MLHRDLFEQLAIERRRKNEEERKKRIFHPKMTIKGVDFAAIPEQIKEKQERKTIEKEREMLFSNQCNEINQLLEKIDHDIKQRKVQESYKLSDFRKHQKRDDPLAPRVKIDSEKEHVSNLQTFVGDDLEIKARTKKQHEQMRVWVMDQVWEREEKKKQQQAEEREYKEYQDQLIHSLEEIQNQKQQLIQERNRRDAEYNLRLAVNKKEEQAMELNDRLFGHVQLMNSSKIGSLIHENPISYDRFGNAIVSEYKGMTQNEIDEIRKHQLLQKEKKLERERRILEEEREYAEYQDRVIQMQDLLDAKKKEIEKEQIRLQEHINDMLREQERKQAQRKSY